MSASEEILTAVQDVSRKAGIPFTITEKMVEGTQLYVVYTPLHPFPDHYTVSCGTLGFRVPFNFPDASPEDCFFVLPADVKLKVPDPVRNHIDIHRAAADPNVLKGTELSGPPALVFSWHLWNSRPWDRNKHTLFDHYTHCLRRFEQQEHDG